MSIQLAIFDLDGTLVDTIKDIAICMNKALSKISQPCFTEEEYKFLVGSGLDRLVDRAIPKEIADTKTVNNFINDFRICYAKQWKVNSVVFDGIKELLTELKEHGIKLAVLSNKPHKSTVDMINELLPGYFDIVLGERVDEGYPKKPDSTVATLIANEFRISPVDALFVGDSDVDMQVAKNADMIAVGVLWGFRTKEELLENGADYLVKFPAEIKKLIFEGDKNE